MRLIEANIGDLTQNFVSCVDFRRGFKFEVLHLVDGHVARQHLRPQLDQFEHLLTNHFEAGIACLLVTREREWEITLIACENRLTTHQKELFKVFVPFLQNRCYLINNFAAFNYVFIFDDLNIGDEMNIRFWENAF